MKSLIFVRTFSVVLLMLIGLTETYAMSESSLDRRQIAIIPIAAQTASGDIEDLKISLNQGLDAGLTVNEIKEILVQMYAYTGFPRSLNALGAFMSVVNERKEKGIKDEIGKEASPLPADYNSLKNGTANQTKLIGQEVKGPLFDFAPAVDEYLKAHLFGDIFERDVLTWQDRELATIAALANLKGAGSQLGAHYAISMHNGITEAQIRDFIEVLRKTVSAETANEAAKVFDQVLTARK
ncbi:carboxymuconolactone decarboxylase family protein [Vibrio sp. NFV-1]|uniref:Carboxymuconolactone decarboxylase family protein n=2 Tax=Vibrio nitrifigilis TaxID=2789781 RepID=A0ABS0GJD6_9VIBR|nr:carboxymuconolactone decarboxylase family protein [Vibrio nitrifigilis]